ncbi:protein transport protein S31 [Coemansia sp. Benny D115]|nr:protein transport protein S31 [Coemansia sp. Benny D115]
MVYQFIERTAIPAWCPQQTESLIAAGTVAGAMDATFSNTSVLEIFKLPATDETQHAGLESIGKVEAPARFQRLAWSGKTDAHGLGVIASGLENGDVTVWDPRKIIDGEEAVLHSSSAHTGAVGGLEFNPFQTNLMASGASNGEVFIWDIVSEFKSYAPGARSQRIENVTDLSWNNQVSHILATASNTGSLVVWDLRTRREAIALSSPGVIGGGMGGGRGGISATVWNPASATQLVTASSDDGSPSIMLWDLRNANAPSQAFSGHQRGILSLSWCRKDSSLLLSSGKDNRTICWNAQSGEIVGELPPSSNWVYDVQWNQANPNLLSGASFDGRINLYALARESDALADSAAPTASDDPFAPQSTTAFAPSLSLKRPPKWLARPCGATFGFGGQLVHFGHQQAGAIVSIAEFVSEPELAQQAQQLEDLLQKDQAAELCRERLEQSRGTDQERSWQVLRILFESNARDELIRFLGFDKAEVKERIAQLIASRKAGEAAKTEPEAEAEAQAEADAGAEAEPEAKEDAQEETKEEAASADIDNPFASSTSLDAEADDFFSNTQAGSANVASIAATAGSTTAPSATEESAADADIRALRIAFSGAFRIYDKAKDIASEDADGLITRAVLLGDIEAAVELCIEQELFADALILATCGSADLAARAQQAYFAKRAQQASYVRLLHSIVTGDLTDVVANGELTEWDEILALLCTYAQGDRFSSLCELLGRRLEQAGELNNAVLCYLASGNMDKVAGIWLAREQGSVGQQRVRGLHSFIEKVSVFRKAVQFIDPALSADSQSSVLPLAPLYEGYVEYAWFLASQGLFDIATRYLERTPVSYKYYLPTGEDGLAALRNLLTASAEVPWTPAVVGPDHVATAPAQTQQQQQPQFQTQHAQAQQPTAYQPYAAYQPAAANMYSAAGSMPTTAGYAQPTSMPMAQHYSAAPVTSNPLYPATNSAGYSGMAQGYPTIPQQQQQSVFPPPPAPVNPATIPTGNTPPPNRGEVAWNDPPMLTKAAKRPPAAAKPAAIISPFPQGRGTPPPAALAPFNAARSPVAGGAPPPRGGFVPAPPAGSATNKPLPPAPAGMAFPNAQHVPNTQQMMQPQHPFQVPPTSLQQQQPMMHPAGFMPPAASAAPMTAPSPVIRGQVVSASAAPPASSSGAAAQARTATPVAAKPASKYPEGDRSHLPSEWVPIVNALNGQLARAKQFAAPAQKRMVEDADRRLNLLFDQMNCDEVKMKEKLAPVFDQLVQALANRQFPQALHYQAELMTMNSDITMHLVGVKHLINVLKTVPM